MAAPTDSPASRLAFWGLTALLVAHAFAATYVFGALWDLRTYFRETYGEEEGTRTVDGFWYAALQRASGILAVYPELLVQDDDDGDLSNGTPNLCAITDIFRHEQAEEAA